MIETAVGFIDTYVLPYWPWILGAVIGFMVIRYALRRVINRVVGVIVGAVILGGATTTGGVNWIGDRGWDISSLLPF